MFFFSLNFCGSIHCFFCFEEKPPKTIKTALKIPYSIPEPASTHSKKIQKCLFSLVDQPDILLPPECNLMNMVVEDGQ